MLSAFPITRRWPPRDPDAIQLYSLPTPNGIKVSTALEEMELPYDAHFVSFDRNDQFTPEFLSLNPNNKIPAIIDPEGPGGAPLGLFESGAILLYLAEKFGARNDVQVLPALPQDGRYDIAVIATPPRLHAPRRPEPAAPSRHRTARFRRSAEPPHRSREQVAPTMPNGGERSSSDSSAALVAHSSFSLALRARW